MNKQKLISLLPIVFMGMLIWHSCTPEVVAPSLTEGKTYLQIRLTDAPGDYQQVNIDVQEVQARVQDSSGSQWYSLDTQAGIYDLLLLQDGVDTVLVNDSLPPGELEELRLILGEDNTVMCDSILQPLEVPSGSQSGLKIKLQQLMIQDSLSTLTLDFDAEASIVARGNGKFNLKPVIRVLP